MPARSLLVLIDSSAEAIIPTIESVDSMTLVGVVVVVSAFSDTHDDQLRSLFKVEGELFWPDRDGGSHPGEFCFHGEASSKSQKGSNKDYFH